MGDRIISKQQVEPQVSKTSTGSGRFRSYFLIAVCVMSILFFAFGGLVAYRTVLRWQSRDWPGVAGTIVRSDYHSTTSIDGSGGNSLDLLIRYNVDGVEYKTDRWAIMGFEFPYGLRKGDKVTVYYNPESPANGVLHRGVRDEGREGIIFAVPMVCMPGLVWLAVGISRLKRHYQEAGHVTVRRIYHSERVSVSDPIIAAAMLGLLVGQMAALFLGVFAVGFSPGVFIWLLAAGPATMVLFVVIAVLTRAAEAGRIIVDRDAATIRFKGSCGMATRAVTANIADLESVGLMTRNTFAWPVYSILIRTRGGREEELKEYRVGSCADRVRYESIVAWLAESLPVIRRDSDLPLISVPS